MISEEKLREILKNNGTDAWSEELIDVKDACIIDYSQIIKEDSGSKKKKIKRKKKHSWIIDFLLALFIFIFLAAGILLVRNKTLGDRTQKALEDIQDIFSPEHRQESGNEVGSSNEDSGNEDEEAYDEAEFASFADLKAINPDIIGWIVVDGTKINYPILCSQADNEYYLNHNFRGEYDPQGSIYIENINSVDFTDFNTVLYGHSMLNGRMFRSLHSFGEDYNFFHTYGDITIYLTNKTLKYKVFECAYIGDTHVLSKLDNTDIDSINQFIERLNSEYKIANKKAEYSISSDNRMITLSTCTTDDNNRIGVFAVLVEELVSEN